MMRKVYGIDLGTTNSCIAEIDPLSKTPVMVSNQDKVFTTPSVVWYDNYKRAYIGGEAKRRSFENPANMIAFVKRELGNPNYNRVVCGDIKVDPVEISSKILSYLVNYANLKRKDNNESPIKDVVITVPADFDNEKRMLTKKAGEMAGLNVLELLSEPAAAALNFGTKDLSETQIFVVYDLGGGTFDVSVMKQENNKFEALITEGNHTLGGLDWDVALVKYVLRHKLSVALSYESIKHTREGIELIEAAEQCKIDLSNNLQATMYFRFDGELKNVKISRYEFDTVTVDLLQKTIDIMHMAFNKSRDSGHIIPEDCRIILNGGMSKMPVIKELLQKEFPYAKIEMNRDDVDLAVAKGAALYAYNKLNPGTIVVKDIPSRSYGIGTTDRYGRRIIRNIVSRKDPMVYDGTITLLTATEGQTSVTIPIYENKEDEKDINRELGMLISEKDISWGYPVPNRTPVTAHLKRDENGIVSIDVECQGRTIHFDIQPKSQKKQINWFD